MCAPSTPINVVRAAFLAFARSRPPGLLLSHTDPAFTTTNQAKSPVASQRVVPNRQGPTCVSRSWPARVATERHSRPTLSKRSASQISSRLRPREAAGQPTFFFVLPLLVLGTLAIVGTCTASATPAQSVNTSVNTDGDSSTLTRPLNRTLLDQSLALGTKFLLASQLPSGTFRYHVNFITGETAPEQGLVRQAGALWGLALIHQDQPTKATREGILRGLAFFQQHSHVTPQQRRFIRYPGAVDGDSGVVALVALTLIDFLRAEPAGQHAALRVQLGQYLEFLLSLRRTDQHFHRKYLLRSGEGWGKASPYFDGEILLALVKAACYADRKDLQQQCLRSADAMYRDYVKDAVQQRQDSATTKGFYQWGSMAFLELYGSAWDSTQPYAQYAINMAHWMIDVHHMPQRRRNTAYALEGVISAYSLALQTDDSDAAKKFRHAIEQGLTKLVSWQVAGPIPSAYLRDATRFDASCAGGILGADGNPWLRIDTTQHQMHATILARRYVWTR